MNGPGIDTWPEAFALVGTVTVCIVGFAFVMWVVMKYGVQRPPRRRDHVTDAMWQSYSESYKLPEQREPKDDE